MMSPNYESKGNEEGEDESGGEDEEYKEDPWYHPKTLPISTQRDIDPTTTDTVLTTQDDEVANTASEQADDERKESKRELRYQIQNEALQRLFRPRPFDNTKTQKDREEQESSSVDQPPPVVKIHEWGQTRKKDTPRTQ
jgi:hypothetical protein